jgi:hypothetical protein
MNSAVTGPGADDLAHDILVAGLARNCGRSLVADVQRIAAALPPFRTVRWFVVESDSDDNTFAVLEQLAREVPHFSFRSLGKLNTTLPLRTQRIAHCRNAYLDHLRDDPACAQVRYLAVADLDGVNTHLDAAGVASCWQRHDWVACSANQIGPYYDIWALRHALWSPGDGWAQARFLAAHGQDDQRAKAATVFSRMITLPADAPWIEVDSAFGGFALYRTEALRGARYEGLTAAGEETCEHVALHAALRAAGGRLFVNPAMINSDSNALSEEYWPERSKIETVTRSLPLRAVLRLFYGQETSRRLRRLLRSVS